MQQLPFDDSPMDWEPSERIENTENIIGCQLAVGNGIFAQQNFLGSQNSQAGQRCQMAGCQFCPLMNILLFPGGIYTINRQQQLSCYTKHAIYTIFCRCGLAYIGETDWPAAKKWQRHNNEILELQQKPEKVQPHTIPFYKHMVYQNCPVQNMTYAVLAKIPYEKVRVGLEEDLKDRLGTRTPHGLNGTEKSKKWEKHYNHLIFENSTIVANFEHV